MSRAERRGVPPPPRLGRVLREAANDFYFNAWSFLGANLVVAAALVIVVLGTSVSPWAVALIVLPILPAAGMMRMATRLIRDFHTDLGEFAAVLRRPWPVFGIGLAQGVVAVVLVGDIVIANAWRSWPGTMLLIGAAYALVALWTYALVAWPLLLDPERDADPVRQRLRLALVVLLMYPVRIGVFGVLMAALLVVSTVLVAPLLTFTLAVIWLASARWVLPLADRVEGRETAVVDA